MATYLHKVVIAALLVLLSACGFQLRGDYNLANYLSPIYLQTSKAPELARNLRAQLRINKVALSEAADAAASKLVIEDVKRSRSVLSVDSQGRAREYEVSYRLRYRLSYSVDGVSTKKVSRNIDLSRELLFDPDSVLAIGDEIETLFEDMQVDASAIMLRHLQAAK